jgi:hypothetical protein
MTEDGRTAMRQQPGAVAIVAIIAGACGVLSTVPVLPGLQGVLLVAFMLGGPGCAAMCWVDLPPAVTVSAVLGISVTSVFSLAVVMAWLGVWYPTRSCVLISLVVLVSGVVRLRTLQMSIAKADQPW